MSCFSRTQDHKDQIEYNYLNTIYFPKEEFIDINNINQSLYEFYGFNQNEILLINNVLNDKNENLSSFSHIELQSKFNKSGKRDMITKEIINESQNITMNTSDIQSIYKLNENLYYHIYDNKFFDKENNDITRNSIIKYNILSS